MIKGVETINPEYVKSVLQLTTIKTKRTFKTGRKIEDKIRALATGHKTALPPQLVGSRDEWHEARQSSTAVL